MLTLGLFSFAYFIYLFGGLVVVFDGFGVVSGFGGLRFGMVLLCGLVRDGYLLVAIVLC